MFLESGYTKGQRSPAREQGSQFCICLTETEPRWAQTFKVERCYWIQLEGGAEGRTLLTANGLSSGSKPAEYLSVHNVIVS